MECPFCGYYDGLDPTDKKYEGPFFQAPYTLILTRVHEKYEEQRSVYGCPNCKGMFIDY